MSFIPTYGSVFAYGAANAQDRVRLSGPSTTALEMTGGTGDDITAGAPVTLDDAAGAFTGAMVGKFIVIAGAASSGNNGRFQISAVNSATQIEYTNPSAVTVIGDTFDYVVVTESATPWYGDTPVADANGEDYWGEDFGIPVEQWTQAAGFGPSYPLGPPGSPGWRPISTWIYGETVPTGTYTRIAKLHWTRD